MDKYVGNLTDAYGNAIGGATVAVTTSPAGLSATLYSDNGVTVKPNPFTTDNDDGSYAFYAANGRYTLTFAKPGYTFDQNDSSDILLYDTASTSVALAYNYIVNSDFEIWGSDLSHAPTAWILGGTGSIAKSTAYFRFGTASAQLTRVGVLPDDIVYIYQDIALIYPPVAAWQGQTLTYGCWVRTFIANNVNLNINDTVGENVGSYHSGSGQWEFLTVTRTISTSPSVTQVACGNAIRHVDTTAQFDGAILVVAPSVQAWQPSGWTGRRSQLFGSCVPSATPQYCAFGAATTAADTSTKGVARAPFKCVARGIYAGTDVDPGVGKSVAFVLRIEGTDSFFTVSVTAGSTEASAFGDVQLNAGDTWSIKITQTAGGAAVYAHAAIIIEEVP